MLTNLANSMISGLTGAVNTAVSVLPDSPFRGAIEGMKSMVGSEMLGYLNYFLPITEMLATLSVWVTAIMLYYIVSIIMRWAKVIS